MCPCSFSTLSLDSVNRILSVMKIIIPIRLIYSIILFINILEKITYRVVLVKEIYHLFIKILENN